MNTKSNSPAASLVSRIREFEGAYLFPKRADALLAEAAEALSIFTQRPEQTACAHEWEVKYDWIGDHTVPGGTSTIAWRECAKCGERAEPQPEDLGGSYER